MQLIYAYLDIKSREIKYDVNFTKKYKCKCEYLNDEWLRSIVKIDDVIEYDHFYGNQIDMMKLVLGENGKGKSTLLQIIGGKESLATFDMMLDCWMLIYHIIDNVFMIESFNSLERFVTKHEFFSLIDDKLIELPIDEYKTMPLIPKYYLRNELANDIVFEYDYHYVSTSDDYFYKSRFEKKHTHDWSKIFDLFRRKNELPQNDCFDSIKDKKRISFNIVSTLFSKKEQYGWIYSDGVDLISNEYLHGKREDMLEMLVIHFLEINIMELYFYDKENRFARSSVENGFFETLTINISKNDSLSHRIDKLCEVYSILYYRVIEYKSIASNGKDVLSTDIYKSLKQLIDSIRDCADSISLETPFSFWFKKYDEFGSEFINNYLTFIKKSKFLNSCKMKSNFAITACSSGEFAYISLCADLLSIIDKKDKECIILLDEPDTMIHPELNRDLVRIITEFLSPKKFTDDYKSNETTSKQNEVKTKYQIIMTSHSPFVVSDFLSGDIVLLGNDRHLVENDRSNLGLACNLGDALVNGFFLKYPIGEFARKRISQVFDEVKKYDNEKKIPGDEYEVYSAFANEIHDNIIRKSFKKLLCQTVNDVDLIDSEIEELKMEILELQKRKGKLV